MIRMSEQITLERSAFSNMHADRRKMTEVIDNRASRYFINEDWKKVDIWLETKLKFQKEMGNPSLHYVYNDLTNTDEICKHCT